MSHEIKSFYGVYLLYCKNPKFKGHTYIGFTVNPNRRIKQHNKGHEAGGARRTSGRGPWDMTLIVHGFPNKISALRFEWAWQNPFVSRRLKGMEGRSKKKNETAYSQKIRILCLMLRTGPWNRLPLTIRWLKQEYQTGYPPDLQPPLHMPEAYGPVKVVTNDKAKNRQEEISNDGLPQLGPPRCAVCCKKTQDTDQVVSCYHPGCKMTSHTLCLAKDFLKGTDMLIPLDGSCPRCRKSLLWGDLMRHRLGCKDMFQTDEDNDSQGEHWADELCTQMD